MLEVKNKSGFICRDELILIYCDKGNLFYVKKNPKKLLHFNLPIGKYLTKNNLIPTALNIYDLQKLPKANAPKNLPERFKIVFTNNPYKCSVDNQKHIIYFDYMFKKFPLPFIDYVKFHELGHYFYSGEGQRSEKLCDLFAYNCMLQVGYNPSQCYWAQKNTLSNAPKSNARKNYVYNKIK